MTMPPELYREMLSVNPFSSIDDLVQRTVAHMPDAHRTVPFDEAFVRRAFKGVKEMVESGMNETADQMPALQFVFTGGVTKEGTPIAILIPQSVIGNVNDKGAVVRAVMHGIKACNGRLMVLLVDEAWSYETSSGEDDPVVKMIREGARISDIKDSLPKDAKGKVVECLMLNALGLDFQYLQHFVIRREGGKVTLQEGEFINARDAGEVTVEGRCIAFEKDEKEKK